MARERPILMTGESVRALLAGHKTKTRRLLRELSGGDGLTPGDYGYDAAAQTFTVVHRRVGGMPVVCECFPVPCPYGAPGDRLWVCEAWCSGDPWVTDGGYELDPYETIRYRADNTAIRYPTLPEAHTLDTRQWIDPRRWKSPVHMPRWASRLTLEVTNVRVERLHQITAEDCLAEGIRVPTAPDGMALVRLTGPYPTMGYLRHQRGVPWTEEELLRAEFASHWDTINSKRAPWQANPWVFVVSFRRVDAQSGEAVSHA